MECIYRFRCLKKLENRGYSEKFSHYLAHTLGKIEETGQSGEAYITKVAEIIKRVTDKYFPCRDLKKFSSRKTWITNRIKTHIKLREKLFQLWLNSKSERAHLNYKNKRNEINMEIKLAKRRDVQNKIDHKDPGEFFNYIRKMKGVVFDTKIIGDLTANAFNDYFLNACEPRVSPISAFCIASDNSQQTQSMYSSYVTDEEVCTKIKELGNKKSIGFDGDDVKILKQSAEITCKYLCIGLNKCISEGIFPRVIKIAKVIPIHKEDKKASPSNYRPISILGNLSKIFKKIVQKRLIRYLEKFLLLTGSQFGFRKKKDTVQAATLFWKTIQSNWATKTNSMGVFLDFCKAFNTVDHEISLQKLHCLGIRGNAYALMASYLTEGKQFVIVNSENSNLQLVKRGVPQGLILGPLLFLVYINDIGSNANIIGVLLLYADDTVLIENSSSETGDLKYLRTWLARNKVDLNYTKSKFVIFERRAKVYGSIELDEQTIAACVSYNYLGIYFDKKLNFDIHIGKVIEKLSKQCGIVYKLRETLNTSHLLAYIRAYVSPIVQYGVLL